MPQLIVGRWASDQARTVPGYGRYAASSGGTARPAR